MKDEYWKLNILHHTAFSMALYRVLEMFEETDKYPLARQTVLAGFITADEVEQLMDHIGKNTGDERLRMTFSDILLLYTVMDIYGKLMLSHKGDTMRQEMKLDEPGAHPMTKQGFDGLLKICDSFVKSMNKEYGNNPLFKERLALLEKLNAFI